MDPVEGPKPTNPFEPCRCVILKLKLDPDGRPIPTQAMVDAGLKVWWETENAGMPECLTAALAVAPALKEEAFEDLLEARAWLTELGTPSPGNLTDRARRQERIAAAAARFLNKALDDR